MSENLPCLEMPMVKMIKYSNNFNFASRYVISISSLFPKKHIQKSQNKRKNIKKYNIKVK